MREHMGLFRGKRTDNSEWIEGAYCKHDTVKVCLTSDDPKTKHLIVADGFCDWGFEPALVGHEVDPDTVGECAGGLTDKNGKMIFEHHIIRDDWGKIFVVYWSDRACAFMVNCVNAKNEYEIGNYRIGKAWCDTISVIGNVVDNPELLKGGEG